MASTLAKSLRADTVSRFQLRPPCVAPADAPVAQVIRQMTEGRTGCALVVGEGGKLAGIFTERDFVNRVVAGGRDVSGPVGEVMTAAPKTLACHESVQRAVELMGAGGYRHIPVVGDAGQPVGVLSVRDIIHYLVEYFPAQVYNLPPTPNQTQPAREGA